VQYTISGTPRRPDHRMVDAQLDREVHPAPPPPMPPRLPLASGVGIR
jgi:hypothetical protein